MLVCCMQAGWKCAIPFDWLCGCCTDQYVPTWTGLYAARTEAIPVDSIDWPVPFHKTILWKVEVRTVAWRCGQTGDEVFVIDGQSMDIYWKKTKWTLWQRYPDCCSCTRIPRVHIWNRSSCARLWRDDSQTFDRVQAHEHRTTDCSRGKVDWALACRGEYGSAFIH